MMRKDLGAIGFTSGFSQEQKFSTVGEQITVEQLIEKHKVMTISKAMVMKYRHHVRVKYTETILHLLLSLHTSTDS